MDDAMTNQTEVTFTDHSVEVVEVRKSDLGHLAGVFRGRATHSWKVGEREYLDDEKDEKGTTNGQSCIVLHSFTSQTTDRTTKTPVLQYEWAKSKLVLQWEDSMGRCQ